MTTTDPYSRALETIAGLRDKMRACRPHVEYARMAAFMFSEFDPTVSVEIPWGATGQIKAKLSVNANGFHDIAGLFDWMRGQGFTTHGHNELPEYGWRWWLWRHEDHPDSCLELRASVPVTRKDSDCKRIKTGVKTEPVYKLVCRGDPDFPEDEPDSVPTPDADEFAELPF